MATLRAAQKALTRKLLLDSALELFLEQGYATTTIDLIATKAGTTRVTFYAYFASRAELMRTLIDENLNAVLARTRLPSHRSTARDLVETVRDGSVERIHAWIAEASQLWPSVAPIIKLARDAAAVDRELASLLDLWVGDSISDIAAGLDQADRFAPETRHYRGVLAMSQFDYTAMHWPTAAWNVDHEQMLELLAASWFDLLGDRSAG